MSDRGNSQAPPKNLQDGLIDAVDSVSNIRGATVVYIDGPSIFYVRMGPSTKPAVIFEHHAREADEPAPDHPPEASLRSKWRELGFNCGGMVISWIGVVGAGALTPVTGGVSGGAAVLLWGGAVASSIQCSASTYEVRNIYRGREDLNKELENSQTYVWTMRGADVIGLVGAGSALKEAAFTGKVLHEAGALSATEWGSLSRPMRRAISSGLELSGTTHVPVSALNKLVKLRLLDVLGGTVGTVGSYQAGIINELSVYIREPEHDVVR